MTPSVTPERPESEATWDLDVETEDEDLDFRPGILGPRPNVKHFLVIKRNHAVRFKASFLESELMADGDPPDWSWMNDLRRHMNAYADLEDRVKSLEAQLEAAYKSKPANVRFGSVFHR